LRILPGPQVHHFAASAFETLQEQPYVVSPHSNRMGYRLIGRAPVAAPPGEMISEAAFFGGLQVPPSGEPILLMADRQTTGGYPQLAVVIAADLPLAAQLVPGDRVEFRACTPAEALAARRMQEEELGEHG
jgi:antagonist of KipI